MYFSLASVFRGKDGKISERYRKAKPMLTSLHKSITSDTAHQYIIKQEPPKSTQSSPKTRSKDKLLNSLIKCLTYRVLQVKGEGGRWFCISIYILPLLHNRAQGGSQ